MADVQEGSIERGKNIGTAIENLSEQFKGYHEAQIEIFQGLDVSQTSMTEVLKRMDKRIDQNEKRIRQNEKSIGKMDNRLIKLETTVEHIDSTVTNIQEEQKGLRARVDSRFDTLSTKIFVALGVAVAILGFLMKWIASP